jgi:transposase
MDIFLISDPRASGPCLRSADASAVKWSQRYRATGSAAAQPQGGKKPYVLVGQRDWLLARITEAPDLTLRAIMAELAGLWRAITRSGISSRTR